MSSKIVTYSERNRIAFYSWRAIFGEEMIEGTISGIHKLESKDSMLYMGL